jgi:hypothetical protein
MSSVSFGPSAAHFLPRTPPAVVHDIPRRLRLATAAIGGLYLLMAGVNLGLLIAVSVRIVASRRAPIQRNC